MSTATATKTIKALVTTPRGLPAIEHDIKQHQRVGKRAAMEVALHVRAIGILLTEAQILAGHGKFLIWAQEKFGYGAAHVGLLQRVAKNWAELQPQIADGSSIWKAARAFSSKAKLSDTGSDGKSRSPGSSMDREGSTTHHLPGVDTVAVVTEFIDQAQITARLFQVRPPAQLWE